MDSSFNSYTNQSPAGYGTKDLFFIGLVCAALLACVMVAHPFPRSAFNDDWSYARVALDLAETGHFRRNGWGSPTIVFQSLWGALWIRLFGFSFNVLRMATLPFSLGFVSLCYLLGLEAGLRRTLALLGALIVAVSPLFVPLAASFMTESYSCFFAMLCLYAAVKCVRATDPKAAVSWLWVLTVAGILGGSNRQSVWPAPLFLLPYCWWIRKTQKGFSVHAAAAYLICLAALVVVLTLFGQRYGPTELPARQWLHVIRVNTSHAGLWALSLFLEMSALSLPALLVATPLWKRLTRHQWIPMIAGCCFGLVFLWVFLGPLMGFIPFLGNMLGRFGILQWEENGLGKRPLILHLTERIPMTFLLLLSLVAWAIFARRSGWRKVVPANATNAFLIYLASYLPLLIPGMLLSLAFDRYLVPVMPLFVIAVLLPMQSLSVSIPKISWICLGVFAAFGVMITHDYAAELEARAEVASRAEQHGIPESRVSTGFERDGWFQTSQGRTVRPVLNGEQTPRSYKYYWFWPYTTAIKPDYVGIVASADEHLTRAVLVVPFTAWTSPHRRIVALFKREDIPKE